MPMAHGFASEYSLAMVCRGGSAIVPECPSRRLKTLAAARRSAGSDNRRHGHSRSPRRHGTQAKAIVVFETR